MIAGWLSKGTQLTARDAEANPLKQARNQFQIGTREMKTYWLGFFGAMLALSPVTAHSQQSVRGLDHVAITVPDLTEAKSFFVEGLGCKTVFDLGPFLDDKGNWMAEQAGTHPRAIMTIAVMQCGNASNVELMEIKSPAQVKRTPARDDIGAASLGFYVENLESSIERVKSAGGSALGNIVDVAEGPEAGRRFIYTRAPWGLLIFLLNDPKEGIPHNKQAGNTKLFSPADLPSN